MCFPSRLIKCCAPPDLSTAELVELVSVLSKTWQSPKLIPKYSLFCKVMVQFLSTLASEGCDEMCSYGWHVCVNSGVHFHFQPVSDYRLLTFAICCFDFFFLRRHSALPTAKCSFRETSHEKHEKLRTVTDSCHWCCTSDIFSAEFHVYEFGIHLTAAGTKSPASSSPAI